MGVYNIGTDSGRPIPKNRGPAPCLAQMVQLQKAQAKVIVNRSFACASGFYESVTNPGLSGGARESADDADDNVSAVPADNGKAASLAADWPQFRGPDGQGHSPAAGLPLRWSESKNIAWKVRIPGSGWSSPVIKDGQIWLTTAIDEGHSLRALCLDSDTGAKLHDVEVFAKDEPGRIHPKNSHATPTPILEGDRVYVHYGAHGTACLSDAGKILWKADLPYYHHHGPGSSPVVVDGLLIVACDGYTAPFYDKLSRAGVDKFQFVAALDKLTGKTAWKRGRDGQHAYATPLAIEVAGAVQVISPGGNRVVAYDPSTGEEIWWCLYKGYSVVPRPVFAHGLVYVCTGYDNPSLLAIRPDGRGDVTDTHVAWKVQQGVPLNPSPLVVDEELYLISDAGIATCLDAKTGERHWRNRLGGTFWASPIAAGGHIYALSDAGVTHVLVPGVKYKRLASNLLEGRTLASPAVSGKALVIRTDRFLYKVEEPSIPARRASE